MNTGAVLITRAEADARALKVLLEAKGFEAISSPLLEIRMRAGVPVSLDGVQAVAATSAHGARALAVSAPASTGLPLFAVGALSAAAAKAAGFARVHAGGGDAAALARFVERRLRPQDGALLHPAGHVRGGVFAPRGFCVRRVHLYTARARSRLTVAAALGLREARIAHALFFSPRTAEIFRRVVARQGLLPALRPVRALCLSAAVAERLEGAGFASVEAAGRPAQDALVGML